jgi:hypothetical protein
MEDPCRVRIEYEGETLASTENASCRRGEPRFTLALFHRDRKGPLRLLRLTGGVRMPSRAWEGFAGSPFPDLGGYFDLTLYCGARIFLHGMLGAVTLAPLRGRDGGEVALGTAVPFRVAFEWQWTERIGAHLQIEGCNNFYPPSGHPRLDEHPMQITAGLSFRPRKGFFGYIGFSEDITRSAPDFAVSAGVRFPLP